MCVSPIMLSYTDCGRKLRRVVPCGKCAECVKDKQNEFVIRSIEEQRKRGSMWFVTLTYSKDNVPVVFDEDGEIVEKVCRLLFLILLSMLIGIVLIFLSIVLWNCLKTIMI